MTKALGIIIIFSAMLLAACSTAKQNAVEIPLENTRWELAELMGKSISEWQYENEPPYIIFEANSVKFNAYGGCNSMFGEYMGRNGEFKVDKVGSTKKFCGGNNIENDFYSAITAAIKYELEGDKLIFYDYSYEEILIFRAKN